MLRLAAALEAKAAARGSGAAPVAAAREAAARVATAHAAFGLRAAPPPGAPPAAADGGDGLGEVGLRQSSGEVGRGRGGGHGCRELRGVATEPGRTTALGSIKCGWLLEQTARPAPHRTAPRRAPRRTAPHRAAPHRTVPHRTAPHRTAPRRTAPHRTVPRLTARARATPLTVWTCAALTAGPLVEATVGRAGGVLR